RVDAAGTIHVVFDDDSVKIRGGDVFYTQSTDAGRTFSGPIKLSVTVPQALQSTLALDSGGNPCVVWTGPNPNPAQGTFATFFMRSTDHGSTFSPPAVASGASRSAQSPKIAVDKNGVIVIAYADFALAGAP